MVVRMGEVSQWRFSEVTVVPSVSLKIPVKFVRGLGTALVSFLSL